MGTDCGHRVMNVTGLPAPGATCPVCTHRAGGPDCHCCRIWRGPKNSSGYPYRSIRSRPTYIHRWVVAQVLGGPIPDGLEVMHLCDRPLCFRIDHLALGTHAENMRDAVVKGRFIRSRKGNDDPCPAGHVDQFSYRPNGDRWCRICSKERCRQQRKAAR